MTFPLRLIVTLAVASAAIAPLAAQAPRSPDSLALAVQERYQQVRDFTAEFVQTLRGGVLRSTESRGEGTVWIKKPGKMRWVYTKPEKQEIVSDGRTMHSYWPEDRQVLKSEVPSDDRAGTSMLFLAGRGDSSRRASPIRSTSSWSSAWSRSRSRFARCAAEITRVVIRRSCSAGSRRTRTSPIARSHSPRRAVSSWRRRSDRSAVLIGRPS